MNAVSSVLLLLMVMTINVDAQSTERFIRVVGNAKHEFKADHLRLNFSISEVAPNEYKKISYKPLEKTYAEVVEAFSAIGLSERDLMRSTANFGKFSKTETKKYYIVFRDKQLLDDLAKIKIEGFKISGVRYQYKNIDPNIETTMSFTAIEDAKRKAEKLCQEMGVKRGKIISVIDRSGGCCIAIKDSKKETY